MTQEIQTVIDRHERAVAILERIKWNIRHIESLIDINQQLYSMFGSLSAPEKEKRDRSIAYRKRMGLLLTCEYESLVNNLHQ